MRFSTPLRAITGLGLMLAASACAGSSDRFPSLAPRPIEQISLAEPARAEPPPLAADAATTARYAPLVDQAKQGDAAFRRVLAEEGATVARGRGAQEGSDPWLAAQVSLSRIETARAPVAKALAGLDAARSGLDPQTDTATMIAIGQASDVVQQISNEEDAALAQTTGS